MVLDGVTVVHVVCRERGLWKLAGRGITRDSVDVRGRWSHVNCVCSIWRTCIQWIIRMELDATLPTICSLDSADLEWRRRYCFYTAVLSDGSIIIRWQI